MLLLLHLWALPRWGLLSQVGAHTRPVGHKRRGRPTASTTKQYNELLACFLASVPQATFAFNTGPLTWSILAFRNSLVFHDIDKARTLSLNVCTRLLI